jgi:DNA-binding XRE family transcriptional regulator
VFQVEPEIGPRFPRHAPRRSHNQREAELKRLQRNYPDLDEQALKAILYEREQLRAEFGERPNSVSSDRLIDVLAKSKTIRWQEVLPGQILLQTEGESSDSHVHHETAAQQIGSLLAAARKEAGLTQTDVGKALGMQQTSIARIEAGKTNPSLGTLEKICTVLNRKLIIGLN